MTNHVRGEVEVEINVVEVDISRVDVVFIRKMET